MIDAVQDEDAVHKVLFLDKRVKSRVSATLVASGPAGYIHFWNVYDTSGPMGRFRAVSAWSYNYCLSGKFLPGEDFFFCPFHPCFHE